ncbi:MAG TPA: cytochrome c [Steroidobacteraceae bacterium]
MFAFILMGVATSSLAADNVTRSGKELYERYCASCHGLTGQGDGPVAKALNVEVPDLTLFARRHNNYFDRDLVERIIDGRHVIGAHGTRTMPVWGEDFSRADVGNPDAERATRIVIVRLADYLWQLQRPAAKSENQ